jgi:hypothetical protein
LTIVTKFVLAAIAALSLSSESEAGPFLRKWRSVGSSSCSSCYSPSTNSLYQHSLPTTYSTTPTYHVYATGSGSCASCGTCPATMTTSYPVQPVRYVPNTPSCPNGQCPTTYKFPPVVYPDPPARVYYQESLAPAKTAPNVMVPKQMFPPDCPYAQYPPSKNPREQLCPNGQCPSR